MFKIYQFQINKNQQIARIGVMLFNAFFEIMKVVPSTAKNQN